MFKRIFCLLFVFTLISLCLNIAQEGHAKPKRWRATWWSDPATTMAIAWSQPERGEALLRYGLRSAEQDATELPYTLRINTPEKGKTYWAQLSGLLPNTSYQFEVETQEGTSRRLWFKTAAKEPTLLKVVAGGDSRNQRSIRRIANQTVAELQPDFVLFGGDFTSSDSKKQWKRWLDDWQLTIDNSGRLIPLLPARGNHDSERRLGRVWGRAYPHFYYGLTFGGQQLRVYTLNSERPAGGEQKKWLEADLKKHSKVTLKWAQYHKPMRPHVRLKSEGQDEYQHWAPLFARFQMDLAIECDSHMMKMTSPLWPSRSGEDGFERVSRGTTYIGEGGWGAPLRSVDDAKNWTLLSGRINHLFYLEVEPTGIYRITPLLLHLKRRGRDTFKSAIGVKVPQVINQLGYASPLIVPSQVGQKVERAKLQVGYSPLLLNPLGGSHPTSRQNE